MTLCRLAWFSGVKRYWSLCGGAADGDCAIMVEYVIVRQLSTVEYTSVASLFYCRQWSD